MKSRLLMVMSLFATLVLGVLFLAVTETDESAVGVGPEAVPSSTPRATKPSSTSRTEIISRLQEILRIREEAYLSRRTDMLESIYSTDCPCLASDGMAIDELLRKKYVWEGVRTSIDVRKVIKVDERMWTVVGSFRSDALHVRTEDGRFIRVEAAGEDLFEFTLVKPPDEPKWLLGLVSSLEGP